MRQTQRAQFLTSAVVFLAELFSDFVTNFNVQLQKAQKIISLHEVHLASIHCLSTQFIGFAGNRCTKTQHLTWFSKLQNKSLTIISTQGELYPSFAQNKNSAGCLPFQE